jgi:ribonuclease III
MRDQDHSSSTKDFLESLGIADSVQTLRTYEVALIPPNGRSEDNRKLENLGDAVLLTVTIDLLLQEEEIQIKDLGEIRSAILSNRSFMKVGESIKLPLFIKSERPLTRSSNGYQNKVASALEAIIGAIYLDQGFDACKLFIENRLWKTMRKMHRRPNIGIRQQLERYLTQHKMAPPTISHSCNRDQIWTCRIYSGNIFLADAKSESKGESTKTACKRALKRQREFQASRKSRKKKTRNRPSRRSLRN